MVNYHQYIYIIEDKLISLDPIVFNKELEQIILFGDSFYYWYNNEIINQFMEKLYRTRYNNNNILQTTTFFHKKIVILQKEDILELKQHLNTIKYIRLSSDAITQSQLQSLDHDLDLCEQILLKLYTSSIVFYFNIYHYD